MELNLASISSTLTVFHTYNNRAQHSHKETLQSGRRPISVNLNRSRVGEPQPAGFNSWAIRYMGQPTFLLQQSTLNKAKPNQSRWHPAPPSWAKSFSVLPPSSIFTKSWTGRSHHQETLAMITIKLKCWTLTTQISSHKWQSIWASSRQVVSLVWSHQINWWAEEYIAIIACSRWAGGTAKQSWKQRRILKRNVELIACLSLVKWCMKNNRL